VGTAASARLLAVGATWRLTGVPAAGRALTAAVSAGAETERTLAGMLLVRAGDRSVPVVAAAIRADGDVAALTDVLASIDSPAAREEVRRLRRP